jgi:hypothetical protein
MAPSAWGPPPAGRRPWSRRRKRLLLVLGILAALAGVGTFTLPDQFGVTSGFLAALCGLLFVAATVVFVAIPGPDTWGRMLRMPPLAGAVTVVAVLLALSNAGESLRWLWILAAIAAAAWAAFAVWESRRSGG